LKFYRDTSLTPARFEAFFKQISFEKGKNGKKFLATKKKNPSML